MNPLIQFDGVSVKYPTDDGGEKVVLNDITLRVRDGEFVTVVGPSGCGKSTALRMILGSQAPTLGTVCVDGEKVTCVGRDRGIVFQKYSLFPHCTVLENIALGGILEDTSIFQRVLHLPRYFRARRPHEATSHCSSCKASASMPPTHGNTPTSSPAECSSAWQSPKPCS